MRFYLISDNVDTQMGMRLAGIDGIVVHTAQEVTDTLTKITEDKEIAVVLITEKLVDLCRNFIYSYKLNHHGVAILRSRSA